MSAPRLRCAIYTRKSSEEGLDQAFNSLDAQREAGEAYVKSQASEGWKEIPTRYDDGGFSGGTMERPALKRLLRDVETGQVDVIVVYKIDRLTRSLADFARIVERFDARGASFVSVTQAFNTTTSMGRLTLNVLLSFAQFEREVTGERIRDKIAASKAKGMWMGGVLPLGFDLPDPGSRTLRINDAEAVMVRAIFARYLELGSVHRLAEELANRGVVSKRRTTRDGRTTGGVAFSRGALFHLLRSPLYIGQIPHKSAVYPGAHAAIIEPSLFAAVQHQLTLHTRRSAGTPARMGEALLTARLFDASGQPMSPTHARGKSGKLYRYYVSAPLQQGRRASNTNLPAPPSLQRVSAPLLDGVVGQTLHRILPGEAQPAHHLLRVELSTRNVALMLPLRFASLIEPNLAPCETSTRDLRERRQCRVTLPVALGAHRARGMTIAGAATGVRRDRALIDALRRAHAMLDRDRSGPCLASSPPSQYERRIMGLALLAPDLQHDILAGVQPPGLTLADLMHHELPLDWQAQRAMFAGYNPRCAMPVSGVPCST